MSWLDGLFDRAEKDEDDLGVMAAIKRNLSLDMLNNMSDDELRQAWFDLSTGVERMVKVGRELLSEMRSRDVDVPRGSSLMRAMGAVSQKSEDEPEDQPATKEDEEDRDDAPLTTDNILEKMEVEDLVRGTGEAKEKVAFVGATPSTIDTIRNKGLAGPTGAVFNEVYLKEMGLDRDDVLVTHLVPKTMTDEDGNERPPTAEEIEKWDEYLKAELAENDIRYVVALGTTAKDALGERADEFVPHPEAVRKNRDTGEVARKLGRLREQVEAKTVTKSYDARVVKSDEERQEITGVVMEPEAVDTDGDWTSEDEIHEALVFYMENSQQMKIQHREETDAVRVVESWQARHKTQIGEESVPAGSWIMTVKVHDEDLWKEAKSGNINGFSIGAVARFVDA